MTFPNVRLRRLRSNPIIRDLTRETSLDSKDLISPVFVEENSDRAAPIESMSGVSRLSLNDLDKECQQLVDLGIPAVMMFGIPAVKDQTGSGAYAKNGIVQQSLRQIKKKFEGKLVTVTDVCLCQYTNHGHCGLVRGGRILNDATLQVLQRIALSHVEAGADIVAPSCMMDGQVQAIRAALDASGFTDVSIMSYAAKHASKLYDPFRAAASSAPSFGDRKSYQVPFSNAREALREIDLDIREGADIVMIKPALPYLDIIYRARTRWNLPIAAYQVSGEYAMIKSAAAKGYIKERDIALESLTAIKRAGADMIITYYAKEAADWLRSN